jgi:hypothetical protein
LDFEVRPIIVIRVMVQDNGNGNLTDSCYVTIVLGDVNEQPTYPDYFFELEENSVVGETVGTVARGYDVDAGDQLSHLIMSGNEAGKFSMNVATGQIRVLKPPPALNYEVEPDYKFVVRVTDAAGLFSEASVFIALKDVNDPPHLTAMRRTVAENSFVGDLIGTAVTGSDEDALEVMRYSIVGGNCHASEPGMGTVQYLTASGLTPGNMDVRFTAKSSGNVRVVLSASNPTRTDDAPKFTIRSGAAKTDGGSQPFCLHYGWPLDGAISDPTNKDVGRVVDLWQCGAVLKAGQTWSFDEKEGRIRLDSNSEYCLHVWNAAQDLQVGSRIGLWPCAVQYNPHQRWSFNANSGRICLRKDPTFCASTGGNAENGQFVSLAKNTATSRLFWSMVGESGVSAPDRYEVVMGEELTVISRCTPKPDNVLGNSMEWTDLDDDNVADGWDVNGAQSTQVFQTQKCATDGSEQFNGGYQRITIGDGTTIISQGTPPGVVITARGEGCDDVEKTSGCGKAEIRIDALGGQVNTPGRGHNVVIYNAETNTYRAETFDTYRSKKKVKDLGEFINSAIDGEYVLIACQDECCKQIQKKPDNDKIKIGVNAMKALGIVGEALCTNGDRVVPVVDKGASGCTSSNKCTECQGDCDSDGDCAVGLKCVQRRKSKHRVPGCGLTGYVKSTSEHDYCSRSSSTSGGSSTSTVSGNDWYGTQTCPFKGDLKYGERFCTEESDDARSTSGGFAENCECSPGYSDSGTGSDYEDSSKSAPTFEDAMYQCNNFLSGCTGIMEYAATNIHDVPNYFMCKS